MENLTLKHATARKAAGTRTQAIIGVVASGNLEVLAERTASDNQCVVEIKTTARGFEAVWRAVISDFVERLSPGGIRFSINDGGARPDTVTLRLAQALKLMEEVGR
jgi:malonate decarboxylase delta subunit